MVRLDCTRPTKSFEVAFLLWRLKLFVPVTAYIGRKYVFSGSQDFMYRSVGEAEPKTREGNGEGRCRDGHDGMAPNLASMTLSTNKLSLESSIAEGYLL